jgi:hypothetical protein
MILKKYKDNYDAEFVNLMLQIENLIENFCKSDKLKINSWAKKLCIPTNNIEFKKNRNLYAIKLLDNVFNGKLEDPFTKFVKDKELKLLDPILVKIQLTSRFLNYIKQLEEDENIYNNPDIDNYQYINNNKRKKDKIYRNKSLIQKKKETNNAKIKKHNFKSDFNIDYYNQILLAPSKHKRSNTSYKNSKNNYKSENNRKKDNLSPSDVLLMENYNNFPYNKKSEILDMRGYYLNNKYEKYKLRNLAEMLNIQRKENNDIILSNKKEIAKLKKRLSLMSVKLKNIYDLQI